MAINRVLVYWLPLKLTIFYHTCTFIYILWYRIQSYQFIYSLSIDILLCFIQTGIHQKEENKETRGRNKMRYQEGKKQGEETPTVPYQKLCFIR